MDNSINTRNIVLNMSELAKIQNTENHRDEMQRQQAAILMQKETALKKDQIQTSNKAEHTEVNTKHELKRENKRKRGSRRANFLGSNVSKDEDEHQDFDEQDHIDLKID